MSRRFTILASIVLAVAVAVGGGLYWFFQDDAPDEVSLDAATSGLDDEPAEPDDDAETAGPGDISGTWVVDAESGEFDYDSATGTFVGFRIEEQLANIGSTTAVGRTGDVAGSIDIDGTTLTAAAFDVDLTTITTNDSRRDDKVEDALEVDRFPTGTFVLTAPVDLGPAAESGGPVAVTAVGDLTLHGVTQPVQIPIEAQVVGDTVVVVGSVELVFADYGVTVPSSPIVLSVEDRGILEVQLLLVRP